MTNLRIGQGYDVHRLTEGRALILGGVTVPYERGLDGHSDADVLTHAIMDALLGAAGLRENGWQVVNLDSTIVAQAPKLAPYRETMRRNLAEALGIDVSRVSVKATTEERLGFTGDGSGMAAQAIALIEREYPRLTRTDALSSGPDRR